MIGEELEQEMLSYYDARAGEYDEFYAGKGPAIRQHAGQYVKDVAEISAIVARFGTGHLIDIACGTGFWAAHYARNCDEITFLDQSGAMLAECERRIGQMGLADGLHLIRGDFFETELGAATYDCAFVGFLLSHITPEREGAFFGRLRSILRPSGQVMIIDGHWSERRRKHRKKEGVQVRVLNDGREFRIYKRYFEASDIEAMLGRYHFALRSLHAGRLFIAAIAERAG